MTKAEAEALGDVLRSIESGRTDEGVRLLRTLIAVAGHMPPPPLAFTSRQPKQRGKKP